MGKFKMAAKNCLDMENHWFQWKVHNTLQKRNKVNLNEDTFESGFQFSAENDFWSSINEKILKSGDYIYIYISSVNGKTSWDYQIPGARLWVLFKKQ